MNHSMNSADRRTHLKIVVVGLLSTTVVAVIASFAHVSDIDLGTAPIVSRPLDDHDRALTGHSITPDRSRVFGLATASGLDSVLA
jgi:hypothetical protein